MKLLEVPRENWQQEYDHLMRDGYLSKKYNRERRIKDLRKFMGEYTPELRHCQKKRVLDIGTGPGEYLEICRELGHYPSGVDALLEDCEMGDAYIRLSKLMTERQRLKVAYTGLEAWIKEEHAVSEFYYIVMRGCIEQIYWRHMDGPRHKETHDASRLSWRIDDELRNKFYNMFFAFEHVLEDGGYLVIHANGAKNSPKYDDLVLRTLEKFPSLQLFKKVGKTFHKIRKVVI
jgi:hypothetical protein